MKITDLFAVLLVISSLVRVDALRADWSVPGYSTQKQDDGELKDQGRSAATQGTADGSRVGGCLIRSGNDDGPAVAPSPAQATVDDYSVGSTRRNKNNLRLSASGNDRQFRRQYSRFYNPQRDFGYSPSSRRARRSRSSFSRFTPI